MFDLGNHGKVESEGWKVAQAFRKRMGLVESMLRFSSTHLLSERRVAQERTGAALRMSAQTVHARVGSANDHHRDDSTVAWISQSSLLAAYGGTEDRLFSRRGQNKDARHDAVVALSGAADLVA